jgi:Ca2+-binding RTX toxin-like protein
LGALVFGLTLGSFIVITAIPASAAPADCVYNAVSRRITVTQTGDGTMVVGGGGVINYDGGACVNNPNVNNTDGVDVVGDLASTFAIDLSGGPFAPGESPEATGDAEIEFTMDTDVFYLEIDGSVGADTITLGVNGVSLNADADVDVTMVDQGPTGTWLGPVTFGGIYGGDGDDILSAAGGNGAGAAYALPNPLFISGDDGNDTINGGSAPVGTDWELLVGGAGDDIISGNAGDDDIDGGNGNDTLNGGNDDDEITDTGVGTAADPTTNDTINGGPGNDPILAGAGNDVIDDGTDNDTSVNGEAGDDMFLQSSFDQGDDTLIGGANTGLFCRGDTVNYSGRTNPVTGTINATSGEAGETDTQTFMENLYGGAGNDSLTGDGGSNVIQGGAGDDNLDGGAGFDFASAADSAAGVTASLATGTSTGNGTDVLANFEGLIGSTGNDTLTGDDDPNDLHGNAGDDTITGGNEVSPLGDYITGDWDCFTQDQADVDPATTLDGPGILGGNDTLDGGDGDDSVYGDDDGFDGFGDGNDTLTGGNGEDDLYGEGGDDTADGGNDDDYIEGDEGNDTLNDTGTTADSLVSDDSDDTIYGDRNDPYGYGEDTINAGEGDDWAAGDSNDGVKSKGIVDGCGGPVNVTEGEDDVINMQAGDDDAFGNGGDDRIHGNDGDDMLAGQEDRDRLFGDAGEDDLYGGEDNDFLNGGVGDDDDLNGGNNVDTLSFQSEVDGGVNVNISQDNATTADGDENVICVENVVGSKFKDTIVGNGADQSLKGGKGNDTIKASSGEDVLVGGQGKDNLIGGDGDDLVTAGSGNDVIRGGAGDDDMNGQAGHDKAYGGTGVDRAKHCEFTKGVEIGAV